VRTGVAKGAKNIRRPVRRPYLRVANVQSGRLDLRTLKEITVEASQVQRFELQAGDVLLTEGGDNDKLGRGAVWQGEIPGCLHQNHVFAVRPERDRLRSEYLSALIGSRLGRRYFAQCSKQTTNLASVNSSQVRGFGFGLPPLGEQARIAALLGEMDLAVQRLDQLVHAKRRFKRGLGQELLTGQRRFKPPAGAASSKRTLAGRIPADWSVRTIGELFDSVVRRNDSGVTLVLTASGEHGLVDQRTYFDRKIAGKDLRNYYLLKRGEFAYNRSLMKGYPFGAIKRLESFEEGVLSSLYLCFALRDAASNGDFFAHLFESGALNSQLRSIVGVGGRAHGLLNVSKQEFFDIAVPVPPKREQNRIAAVLTACDHEIELLRRLHEQLDHQRQGVSELLLTGKMRVPEAAS